jgi:hypothetical protein
VLRNPYTLASFALALAVLASPFTAAEAQLQPPAYVGPGTASIQEDWVLVVAKGDPANDGPQIQTYMSSVADSSLPYAWFMLNVRDNPYAGGGVQVQVWTYSDQLLASSTLGTAKLNTPNETIKWTQTLAVVPGSSTFQLIYTVSNTSSTTWGSFGLNSGLNAVFYADGQVAQNALTTYDPTVSVAKSRVGFQSNNVTSLGIVAIRQYDKNGKLLKTDTTSRPVNLSTQ